MKKLTKIIACIALALIVPFGLVGCDKEQIEENTKTAIEAGATIVPVEYKQETAEGIFKNALQKLLSSDKSQIVGRQASVEDGVYLESTNEQRVMIKDGKRYTFFNFDGFNNSVLGVYDDKLMLVDLKSKTYKDLTPVTPDPDEDPDGQVAIVTPALVKLDLITALVKLSESVVSGRYFDGATYINIKMEEADYVSNVEVKIVDGVIVGFETMLIDGDVTGWASAIVTYGETVDTSVIPTTLEGYTAA